MGKVSPPENKCNKKYAFQLTSSVSPDLLLAAESAESRKRWMSALGLAAIGYKEISGNGERRSGPDLTKITTGPVSRRDQAPLNSEPRNNLSRKSLSVENINRLKPVLMKNINLDRKNMSTRDNRCKSDILDIVLDEDGHGENGEKSPRRPKPHIFLETDF